MWDIVSGDFQCRANNVIKLMGSLIWPLPAGSVVLWLCGSVALFGEGSEKGHFLLPGFLSGRELSPRSQLDVRHFISSLYAMVPFKLLLHCWSSEGVSLSNVMCGVFKSNCLGLQRFLFPTHCPLVFTTRSYGY